MNEIDDIPTGVDERTERLMSRVLDGEADAQERAELAGVWLRDPAARALFDQYERFDKLAATAFRRDLTETRPTAPPGRFRSWRLGAAAAALSAAAVIALSFLPNWQPPDLTLPENRSAVPTMTDAGPGTSGPSRMIRSPAEPAYLDVDHQPVRKLRDIRQDFIGVPGKNKDQIYIFERNTQTTRLVPVSGDV